MIQARGVSLSYDVAAILAPPVLANVDLDVHAGEFVSIVGPSGCGKSTLLKLVAGLLRPTAGALTVGNEKNVAPHVGFVFQDPTLLPWRTVAENIGLPLELAGATADAIREAVAASIATIGLSPADRLKFPRMLSGGMRMRVSLARVLVEQPQVLLFDEPFAALDDLLRQQLNEELMAIWLQRRPTALFVTHNIAEAVYLSQRVLFMSQRPGAIAGELTVDFDYPRPRGLRTTTEFAQMLGQATAMLEGAASAGKEVAMSQGATAFRSRLARMAPPAILFVLFLASWQLAVIVFGLKPYLLPGPIEVAKSAWREGDKLLVAMATTGSSAVCGLLLAIVGGVAVSFAFAQSAIVRKSFFPYAIFLQTTPIVAIAPLLINWFGSGQRTVIVVSFIICLFPIVVNVTAGLTSVSPELSDLFRLYRATRWQRFAKLQMPHAVSYLIAGARTSSGLSVVGAIVGEFYASFGGTATSLGHLMVKWQNAQMNGALIAAVAASTLLGVSIFAAVGLVSRTLLRRWSAEEWK